MGNKLIRSVCVFNRNLSKVSVRRVNELGEMLTNKGFEIQTKRLCSEGLGFKEAEERVKDTEFIVSLGNFSVKEMEGMLGEYFETDRVYVNVELSHEVIDKRAFDLLFSVIRKKPSLTFNFTFSFNVPASSPFFPSGRYEKDGFSVGLQSTDLAEGCENLDDWFEKQEVVWQEVMEIFQNHEDFLGIDSSIAAFANGKGSLINFVKKIGLSFNDSVKTELYLRMSRFIIENNPKPIGLCGLMFPCLEDFELAEEYEKGKFSIERNIFLSLHSGLGVDTYPIGVDEKSEKVVGIFKLLQGLSNKHKKPLSCRFVSDGKAKIGEKTDFKNQYLKDVIIRPL